MKLPQKRERTSHAGVALYFNIFVFLCSIFYVLKTKKHAENRSVNFAKRVFWHQKVKKLGRNGVSYKVLCGGANGTGGSMSFLSQPTLPGT